MGIPMLALGSHLNKTMAIFKTYILLHIMLSRIHGTFAYLEAHLCSSIVHEVAERRLHAIRRCSLPRHALLSGVSISALRLRGRLRRRRRP